ncbi:hypothetical protein [Gluconacetobacter takamatsuzukensis]|uniref:Uncharacterized protein n=1 Tax=Gluconacetobacter takamatsuzukensis TaxID=1286190 RepID=A0A7W4PQJ1_9PROT|nr:hypothetical protein [Gluconacetobacter takamatsuzukensis]MBB2206620.1 hypothetical protein [Gluconacetobacter takamatsuzukensis]
MSHAMYFVNDLSCSERLAVWMIRCVARRETAECGTPGHPGAQDLLMTGFRAELDGVAQAFRAAMRRMVGLRMGHLDVGMPGAVMLTATEQGFLEAASAAQNGNEAAVRTALRRVFPHHYVQSRFAAAVTVLAACLAGAGHWLPSRRPALAALPPVMPDAQADGGDCRHEDAETGGLIAMTRWHELDMGMSHSPWPHPESLGLAL